MTSSTAVAPYARFLLAKRSVDDRSLNAGVLSWLRGEIGIGARRFVEIGGGVGTMVARLYGQGIAVHGEYLLIDEDARMLAEARRYLAGWAAAHGVTARDSADGIVLGDLAVTFLEAEIGAYTEGLGHTTNPHHYTTQVNHTGDLDHTADFGHTAGLGRAWHAVGFGADVLIGCAVLDVLDVPRLLPGMLNLLKPGGLYWFPITYDGEMGFLPEHPADAAVIAAYHADMDRRERHGGPGGERFAGRHLIGQLRSAGAAVRAAGSADWVVLPGPGGRYQESESDFVATILDTMESALVPAGGAPAVDRHTIARWLSDRRARLARGDLIYLAHNLDVAGRAPS
jgi:SAM-dependent methyltransferase